MASEVIHSSFTYFICQGSFLFRTPTIDSATAATIQQLYSVDSIFVTVVFIDMLISSLITLYQHVSILACSETVEV